MYQKWLFKTAELPPVAERDSGSGTGVHLTYNQIKVKEDVQVRTQEKGLTTDQICKSTGLSECSLNWILDNGGFTGDGTLKALAVAAGVELKEIVRPAPSDNVENGIEFIKDAKMVTVQFCQGRYKSRIKKLAEKHPEKREILAKNPDGTLLAHIPVEWMKISPPVAGTELQRELSRERMLAFHGKHTSTGRETV